LDELGDLPLSAQAKLSRVLEDGRFEPVGSSTSKIVDVRLVAATNKRLHQEVEAGRFRQDLYYRLNATQIQLPALRYRRTEIVPLALHLLDGINAQFNRTRRISVEALAKLERHSWPGNVRELRNVLQRAVIFSRKCEVLAESDITLEEPDPFVGVLEPFDGFNLNTYVDNARAKLLNRALELA
jgi:Nif-specific regulatory protein